MRRDVFDYLEPGGHLKPLGPHSKRVPFRKPDSAYYAFNRAAGDSNEGREQSESRGRKRAAG